MAGEGVLVRNEAPLGWLVFNRPEVRNALNFDTWKRIADGMQTLETDDAIRVIILRGVGPEAFISGADISEFLGLRANAEQEELYHATSARAIASLTNCKKPVLAMCSGLCIGGGVSVALSTDIRIAARGTKFGIPAARLGLAYPRDGIARLIHTIGWSSTLDMLMSARIFEADEALAMGLINKVVEGAELEDFVREYAGKMAKNAPLTMMAAKTTVRDILADPEKQDRKHIEEVIKQCFESQDYQEGIRAFKEKRSPRFQGR